jgi:hypothetical protein
LLKFIMAEPLFFFHVTSLHSTTFTHWHDDFGHRQSSYHLLTTRRASWSLLDAPNPPFRLSHSQTFKKFYCSGKTMIVQKIHVNQSHKHATEKVRRWNEHCSTWFEFVPFHSLSLPKAILFRQPQRANSIP